MKEIKEKVRDQSPKIRNPASRLPKELVRSAMLEANRLVFNRSYVNIATSDKRYLFSIRGDGD